MPEFATVPAAVCCGAQGCDGQGVTHCAHPGSGTTTARIAGDGGNRRGCIRVGAIRWV